MRVGALGLGWTLQVSWLSGGNLPHGMLAPLLFSVQYACRLLVSHTSCPPPQFAAAHLLANCRFLAAGLQLEELVLRRRVQLLHGFQARLGRSQHLRQLRLPGLGDSVA